MTIRIILTGSLDIGLHGLGKDVDLKVGDNGAGDVSHLEITQSIECMRNPSLKEAYPSAVYAVVNSTKFSYGSIDHVLYLEFIGDVGFNHQRTKAGVRGILLTLFSGVVRTFLIYVCKDDPFCTSFGKCKSGLLSYASSSLKSQC